MELEDGLYITILFGDWSAAEEYKDTGCGSAEEEYGWSGEDTSGDGLMAKEFQDIG